MKNVCWASVLLLALAGACTKKEAPQLAPAAAPPPPPPQAAAVVRDAATDVGDAATDAASASAGGKRWVGTPPSAAAGGGGLRVEGSLSRTDGDKVIRAAQPKLRACFDEANPKGGGAKGRVSFKLTINDRGHVTLTEIPTSSLPGGSDVETCMVHVLRDLRFPRGSGDSSVSFQMSFAR